MRRSYTLLLVALSTAPVARACPSVLFAVDTAPRLRGARKGLRLFTLNPPGTFRLAPIQVDPVDGDGRLRFDLDPHYADHELDNSDFMTIRLEDFGPRADLKKNKLPCRGNPVLELRDPNTERYAYLTNCGSFGPPFVSVPAVNFQPEKDYLESPVYNYRFNPDNYMQFSSINFRDVARGTWQAVASSSALMIHADAKNFFTMDFDASEIESQLEAHRAGPLGNMARLSFYLKILFFKIRMSLSTDVGFYEDSSHIPMMVSIPVDASKYLNPGSGILYTWILGPLTQGAPRTIQMPALSVPLVKKGWRELAKDGLKFCFKDQCTYKYAVDIGGRSLSMDLVLDRKLVARGFFPIYVEDARRHQDAMNWDFEFKPTEVRTGMYFEVSGLQAGGHPWDFWLRLGSQTSASASCPAPMTYEAVKDERF